MGLNGKDEITVNSGKSLPDIPAIAVLPFVNMSGDPEQEYFSDGITEDIITVLTRFRSLSVVARNSTFSYKGQATKIQEGCQPRRPIHRRGQRTQVRSAPADYCPTHRIINWQSRVGPAIRP